MPFTEPLIQIVGGWIRLTPQDSFLVAFQRIELAGVLQLTAGSWRLGEPLTANGALLAYRRAAFEAVGGWGEAASHPSGDDDLLVQRIRLHFGSEALAFSAAVVETCPALNWHSFLQQRLRWLSKRHLYPAPWTRLGMGIVALAQITLVFALLYEPIHALLAWGMLSSLQGYIARQGFLQAESPLPAWYHWVLTAMIYPFYQVLLILLALLHPSFQWKGRRYAPAAQS